MNHRIPLEKLVSGIAAGALAASVINAREKQSIDRERRVSIKGNSFAPTSDNRLIEYQFREAISPERTEKSPLVVLEAGLGEALESWDWVSQYLSQKYSVLAYHRRNYGLTTSSLESYQILETLVDHIQHEGPLILVTHSIGNLVATKHLQSEKLGKRVAAVVVVDGTDPKLLEAERDERKKRGKFIQLQAHTMLSGVSGFYSWNTNIVERQIAFDPDTQFGYVQHSYRPKNIITATREYFSIEAKFPIFGDSNNIPLLILGSSENNDQQRTMASEHGGKYSEVSGSNHRSIIGYRRHAGQVAQEVQDLINAII